MSPLKRSSADARCDHIDDKFHVRKDCRHISSVELKVGISHGLFLCDLALRHPHRFFIGVELNPRSCDIARDRVASSGATNVQIFESEALEFMQRAIPDGSIDILHVYHPTPYPGTVGLERRLISREFEAEAHRILRPWGSLRLATDHHDYYRKAIRYFASSRWWAVEWDLESIALERGCIVGTPVEQEHRAAGRADVFMSQLVRLRILGSVMSP